MELSTLYNHIDEIDFEKIIKNDTSFFSAFRNLRFANYSFSNDLYFQGDSPEMDAVYKSINKQNYVDSCRSMVVLQESVNRNLVVDGVYQYYTAKMYDSLFYTKDMICKELRYKPMVSVDDDDSIVDKYIDQLKVIIFSPGIDTDLPIVGGKTVIFSKKMRDFYQMSAEPAYYQDEILSYVFKAWLKPDLDKDESDNLVVRYLETYFDAKNMQVLSRKYHVKYNSWFFDFDVKMDISIQENNGEYYPQTIKYDGNWDVIGIKEEVGKFEIKFYDLK